MITAAHISNIRAIDPATRRASTITREGFLEALGGILRSTGGCVILLVADLFQPDEI